MDSAELLIGLNDQQREAVTHGGGPLLIVAGAGTGKTMAITRRIGWLIAQNLAKPENILALTFTDKASGEMEERVDRLLPYGYVDIQISTFHAFCEKILREFGAEIGLPRDFKLVNELDAWLLARKYFDRFALDYYRPLGNPTKYLRGLLTHFSRAKDSAITPERYLEFAANLSADADTTMGDEGAASEKVRISELAGAYHTYQQLLLENDCLDFGDLLLSTYELLTKRPNVLAALRARYAYCLVDEFQDTNFVQYQIIRLLAAPNNNLTVVGDDDQSIYKFRGASLENILQFEKDYPDAKRIVLTDNYRSGQAILDKAHAFIQNNNPNRLEAQFAAANSKKLAAHKDEPGIIEHLHAATVEAEAAVVARKIQELKDRHPDCTWGDFGILVRANDAAGPFLSAMDRRGIPYQFLALRGLYAKPIILDVLAHLRMIDNPFLSPSFYRILSRPWSGVSALTVAELNFLAQRKGRSLYEAARAARTLTNLPPEEVTKIETLMIELERLARETQKRPASEMLLLAAREGGYVQHIKSMGEREAQENFRFLQQLYERILSFEERNDDASLHNFLAEFAFERDAGEEGALSPNMEEGPEAVRVMTVHAAKGLEFRFVFVVNLVDQRFPTRQRSDAIPLPEGLAPGPAKEGEWHLEEERRLFYVAMTRAKDGLFLTSADDYGGARTRKLSRFLLEADFAKPTAPASEPEEDWLTRAATQPAGNKAAPFVIHLPKQFSFTQLTAFRSCPLQYKYAHVLKIPVMGKWTFSFGKTMHNTLHQFFLRWIERAGTRQATLFGAEPPPVPGALPVREEELLEIYQGAWIDEWFTDNKQREEYRRRGSDTLKDYYGKLAAATPKPLALEQSFTLKFGPVVIKGRIDRIDATADGVRIIDYKTGKPKSAATLERGDKEQLFLYQIAAKEVLGLEPKILTYHYLEDNSEIDFLATPEELTKLKEEIVERVQKIKQSEFLPTPGFHCRFCDFNEICEYRSE